MEINPTHTCHMVFAAIARRICSSVGPPPIDLLALEMKNGAHFFCFLNFGLSFFPSSLDLNLNSISFARIYMTFTSPFLGSGLTGLVSYRTVTWMYQYVLFTPFVRPSESPSPFDFSKGHSHVFHFHAYCLRRTRQDTRAKSVPLSMFIF